MNRFSKRFGKSIRVDVVYSYGQTVVATYFEGLHLAHNHLDGCVLLEVAMEKGRELALVELRRLYDEVAAEPSELFSEIA